MKVLYAKAVADQIGNTVTGKFFVERVSENQNRDGKKWYSYILRDVTGRVHGKMWSEKIEKGRDYSTLCHKVVDIEAYVDLYDGEASLVLQSISETSEYDPADFAAGLTAEQIEQCQAHSQAFINMISNVSIKSLVEQVYGTFFKMMCSLPGGKTLHHAYNGGLIMHTLEVTEVAVNMADTAIKFQKPYSTPINRDIVIAGALVHDIGKVAEYKPFPTCVRTQRGTLIGHLVEGVKCIEAMNSRLARTGTPCDVDTMFKLEHCILASHGGEGGGCKPMLKEAVIIKNADMMSAETDGFDTAFKIADETTSVPETKVWNKFTEAYAYRET